MDSTGGGSQDTSLRVHDTASNLGRFLGTTDEWVDLGSSPDAGYAFLSNTDYVGVFSITRTGDDSVELFSSLSLASGDLLDSRTDTHDGVAENGLAIANNIGMLGFWANSNTFGSTNGDDPDNGLTFTNVRIQVTAIPEPGTASFLLLGGLLTVGLKRRRR